MSPTSHRRRASSAATARSFRDRCFTNITDKLRLLHVFEATPSSMSVAAMPGPSRTSSSAEDSYYPVSRTNTMSSRDGSRSLRQSKRYSVNALYASISAKEKDMEIEDELAKAQKMLRDLKAKISTQSKRNFVLEKDVRYLDSRIALLIQNRLRIEEARPQTPSSRRPSVSNIL